MHAFSSIRRLVVPSDCMRVAIPSPAYRTSASTTRETLIVSGLIDFLEAVLQKIIGSYAATPNARYAPFSQPLRAQDIVSSFLQTSHFLLW